MTNGAQRQPKKQQTLCFFALLCVCTVIVLACQTKQTYTNKDIVGAWKTDSIFQYTNGFVERKGVLDPDENIVYEYDRKGRLLMKKDGEQRNFQFEVVAGDSLIYRDAGGFFMVGYRILALGPDKLVLKKKQAPLFPGPNQEVYEIRQFSPATQDE
ncbi:hypothetical protein [Spirosoma lituiforme]